MKRLTKFILAAFAASMLMVGGPVVSTADAGVYGRTGLGSNLHRRFVIKQARRSVRMGRAPRQSAILWWSQPQVRVHRGPVMYRSYRGYRGW